MDWLNRLTDVFKLPTKYVALLSLVTGAVLFSPSYDGEEVFFWARSRNKKNKPRPFRLSGCQFVHRWSQHILPKGFTKSRNYGGYHNTKRAAYLKQCRRLLELESPEPASPTEAALPEEVAPLPDRKCPHCEAVMVRQGETSRTSWGKVLDGPHRPEWYYAFSMCGSGRADKWYSDGY